MRVFICLRNGDNMKKIIKIIAIIGSFFIMSKNCYAIDIVKEDIDLDIKIHLKADNINETRKIIPMMITTFMVE